MLDEALTALASAAGAAVATAAGTDAWTAVRERTARLFGRENAPQGQRALERLDQTAAAIESAVPGEAGQTQAAVATAWQTRFQDLLEDLEEPDRRAAVEQLQALLGLVRHATGGMVARDGGVAIGGNADLRADRGSVAAVRTGDVTVGNPQPPGPDHV